jgi:ankyrin repeat protein
MTSRLNVSAAVWTPSVSAAPAVQQEASKVDSKQKRFAPRSKRPRQLNTERITAPTDNTTATEHVDGSAVAPDAATHIRRSRTRRNPRHVQQRQQKQQQQQRLHASADDAADVHTARPCNTRRRQQSKSSRLQAAPIAGEKAVNAVDEAVTASAKETTNNDSRGNDVLAGDAFPALPSATTGKQAAAAVSYTALVDKLAAEQRNLSLALASADSSSAIALDGVKLSLLEHKKRSLQQCTVDNSSSTEIADVTTAANTCTSINNNALHATATASCITPAQTVLVAARPSTELKERWRERWFTLELQRIAALQRQQLELQLMTQEDKLPKAVTAATVRNTSKHLQQTSYAISNSSSATVSDSWHTRLRPTFYARQAILTAPCTVTVLTHAAATAATAATTVNDNNSSSDSSCIHDAVAVMLSPVLPVTWFDAVRSNSVQAVIEMLNTGTIAWDIREDSTHRMTAIHIAAQYGHASVLQALLNVANVAGTSVKERSKATPLHYAVRIDSSSNMNADMQQQQLHSQLQCVHLLLKHGARCDTKDKNGMTVLHIAAANGFSEAVGTILSNGRYKINTRNKHGTTALQCAIEHSCAHSTSMNGSSSNDTAAHDDESDDNILAVCSLLLAAGAAVDIPNDHGMTAICTTAVYGATELLMMLLSTQQAKPSHTHHQKTTRHSTSVNSNANVNVGSVRSKAISNNVVSQQPGINMSLSPLHEAAAAGQTDAVKVLLNVSESITVFTSRYCMCCMHISVINCTDYKCSMHSSTV